MGTVGLSTPLPFLSTPSARRATIFPQRANVRTGISIHALREEGDRIDLAGFRALDRISIHALREEGDWDIF